MKFKNPFGRKPSGVPRGPTCRVSWRSDFKHKRLEGTNKQTDKQTDRQRDLYIYRYVIIDIINIYNIDVYDINYDISVIFWYIIYKQYLLWFLSSATLRELSRKAIIAQLRSTRHRDVRSLEQRVETLAVSKLLKKYLVEPQ